MKIPAFLSRDLRHPFRAPPTPSQAPDVQVEDRVEITSSPTSVVSGFGGCYPRLVQLPDGNLLSSLTTFAHGENILRVACSHDGGRHFEPRGVIARGVGDIDNIHVIALGSSVPGGSAPRLLAAYRNHLRDAQGTYTLFRISLSSSDDGGASWHSMGDVERSHPPYGLWEPFLYAAPNRLHGASLQIYYARELPDHSQDIVLRRSADEGASWGPLEPVAGYGMPTRAGMPGVATLRLGARLASYLIFETCSTGGGPMQIMMQRSVDDGLTWAAPTSVYRGRANASAAAPQIAAADGCLVATVMTAEDAPPKSRTAKALAGRVQGDNVAWGPPTTFGPPQAYWPGLTAGGQGELWLLYNHLLVSGRVAHGEGVGPQG